MKAYSLFSPVIDRASQVQLVASSSLGKYNKLTVSGLQKQICWPFMVFSNLTFYRWMEKLRTNIRESVPTCAGKLVLDLGLYPHLKMMEWKTNTMYILIVPSLPFTSGMFCIYVGYIVLSGRQRALKWDLMIKLFFKKCSLPEDSPAQVREERTEDLLKFYLNHLRLLFPPFSSATQLRL